MDGLPWPKSKPDFMAPSPRILYEQGIRHDHDSGDEDDEHAAAVGETDEPDRGGRSFPYYESDKILGTLYRNIDERQFLEQIREGAQSINASPLGLVPEIWEMIEPQAAAEFDFRQYENDAMEIKQMYEDQVIDLMATYSTKPWSAKISEIEVVTGTILGKDGTKQSRQQEENSRTMKQRYDEIVDRTKEAILGPRGTRFDDPFQRTAACLAVAVAAPRKVQRLGYLRSFSWISVYMCLHEMERTSGRRVIEWGARAASEQRQDPEQPRSAAANAQSSQGSAEGSSQSTIREVKRAEQQENPVPIPEPPVGSEPVSIRSKKRELGGAYSHIPRSGRPSPATSSSRSSSAHSTRSVRYGSSSASSRRSRTAPSPLSEPFSPLQEDSITSEAVRISDEPSNSEAGHWPPSPSMQACLDQLELGLNLPDISLAIQMFEYNPRYRDSSGSAQDAKIKEQAKGARVGSRPSTNVKAHASASNDKASRPLNKPFKTQTHPSIRDLSHFESGVGERTIKQEDPAKPRTIPASSQVPTSKSWTSTVPAADSSTLPVRNSSRPAMITSQSLRNAVRGSNQHPIMIDEDTPLEELEELARWKAERTCIGWEVTKE